MKKHISGLLIAFVAIVALCSATGAYVYYTNIPRFAPTTLNPYVDNTGRNFKYEYDSLSTDVAGLDTIYLAPRSNKALVYINTIVDSVALFVVDTNSRGIPTAFKGDEILILATNSSGGKAIKWAGPNWAPATTTTGGAVGTAYFTASKKGTLDFVFDGSKWVEVSRMLQ